MQVCTLLQTDTTKQPFNGLFSRTTWISRYQKGKTNLDFTGARDSEWQWHQLGYMQVCTSLQTDNHASTQPLSFLQAGCPSCCPANSCYQIVTLIANYNKLSLQIRGTKYFHDKPARLLTSLHNFDTSPKQLCAVPIET